MAAWITIYICIRQILRVSFYDQMLYHYLPMQAIALSLKDSAGFLDVPTSVPSLSPGAHAVDKISSHKERNSNSQDDVEKRKRKKMVCVAQDLWFYLTFSSLLIHFFFIHSGEADK